MLLLFLLILLIVFTFLFKIQSYKFAYLLLLFIGFCITVKWFDNNNIINSNECLIGKVKKINGLFFNSCVDYWHLLHIVLYILIGLLYPNDYSLILIISIIWELYEHFMFKYLIKKSKCNEFSCLRIEDVFLNLFGYFIGSSLAIEITEENKMNNQNDFLEIFKEKAKSMAFF